MPLLRLDKVNLAYGHRPLLENADLEIFRGERVCLLGRNGEGKSSMMRLVSGQVIADDGTCCATSSNILRVLLIACLP